MTIKQYDKIILKDGRTATIVEVLEEGKAYIADVDLPDDEWDTIDVWQDDIREVIDETQQLAL